MSETQKLSKIEYTGYYSVYNRDGKKIADCGWESDAINLVKMDQTRTYRKVRCLNPETINIPHEILEDDKQLPEQKILPESQLEPLNLV